MNIQFSLEANFRDFLCAAFYEFAKLVTPTPAYCPLFSPAAQFDIEDYVHGQDSNLRLIHVYSRCGFFCGV